MALVNFLSGGYNLHWFSDVMGLVSVRKFYLQLFHLQDKEGSCGHAMAGFDSRGFPKFGLSF